jgi:GT2 family glycosyltransferase
MVLLSFIIVSWNAKRHLLNCLNSLQRCAAGLEYEILVVDNASGDGSAEAVREGFPQVKLICNSANVGFARANNQALREAKGSYLLLVNSDIEVLPDCLQVLVTEIGRRQRVGVIAPRILNGDRTLQASCYRFPKLWRAAAEAVGLHRFFPSLVYCSHEHCAPVEALNGCFLMVRREAFAQVGGLDERFFMYAEDIDWCKRFSDCGWDLVYVPEAQVIHYGGQSSANAPVRFYLEMQKANRQYYMKHGGLAAAAMLALVVSVHQAIRLGGGAALFLLRPSQREAYRHKLQRSAACLSWLLRLPCRWQKPA